MKSTNDDCGKMEPVWSRWLSFPERDSGCLSLLLDILFLLIPFVLPSCMTFFFSDLFHFSPSFALLSFLISLITFLSLYFSVNLFLFSSPFISAVLVCHFVSYAYFISAVICLFIDTVFVAESLMLVAVPLGTAVTKLQKRCPRLPANCLFFFYCLK
jgi:hypothetical protein